MRRQECNNKKDEKESPTEVDHGSDRRKDASCFLAHSHTAATAALIPHSVVFVTVVVIVACFIFVIIILFRLQALAGLEC